MCSVCECICVALWISSTLSVCILSADFFFISCYAHLPLFIIAIIIIPNRIMTVCLYKWHIKCQILLILIIFSLGFSFLFSFDIWLTLSSSQAVSWNNKKKREETLKYYFNESSSTREGMRLATCCDWNNVFVCFV